VGLGILFVDRDLASTDSLVPSLERKGYEVSVARTLNQAQKRLASFHPDLYIVNVASFRRTGVKVADGVRELIPDAPRILIVEKGSRGVGCKADECITLPCTPRSLLYRVAKMAKSLTVRELRAGPLLFELGTRSLRRSGQEFILRPKEAALLAFFMRNPGRVLTREEIIRSVWETDSLGDTRTLSVHVRWLREKIEGEPHHPRLLRTVRGVGYRFEASENLAQP